MKSTFLYSLVVMALLYTGCSQKAPEVEPVVINKNTPVKVESEGANNDVIGPDAINGGSIDDSVGQLQPVEEGSNTISVGSSIGTSNDLEPVYFEFDKSTLNDEELDKASNNARKIIAEHAPSVRLEGNCDEWGTDEYNFALGLKRAKSVKEVLVVNGVKRDIITVISNGESKPVCTEHNEACWKRNRRVDFIVR